MVLEEYRTGLKDLGDQPEVDYDLASKPAAMKAWNDAVGYDADGKPQMAATKKQIVLVLAKLRVLVRQGGMEEAAYQAIEKYYRLQLSGIDALLWDFGKKDDPNGPPGDTEE